MLDKKNFYINGKWVKPKQKKDLHVIDPSTEENCAIISLGSPEDINIAVSAAKKAFESWAFTSKEARIKLLESLYSLYKKRWEEMAKAISLEMGAPIEFSTQLQAGTGASHIKSYIKVLKDYKFEKILGDHAPNNKILHEPKGVCALITPWNWPMNQVCLKVIPASNIWVRFQPLVDGMVQSHASSNFPRASSSSTSWNPVSLLGSAPMSPPPCTLFCPRRGTSPDPQRPT